MTKRNKIIHAAIFLIFLTFSLLSLKIVNDDEPPGPGNFLFHWSQKKIKVWTYKPREYTDHSPILFVIHGVNRDAQAYRDAFCNIAERNNALVIAPEFSEKSRWSFFLIEYLFDYVKKKYDNSNDKYLLFGHSAGAQFVHQMIIFHPQARVKIAVAANAGWYTFPDSNIAYPYGIKNANVNLKNLFSKKLIILLGKKDNIAKAKDLNISSQAMVQGKHRLARGTKFYDFSKTVSKDITKQFEWKLVLVDNVGHRYKKMAVHSEKYLFPDTNNYYKFWFDNIQKSRIIHSSDKKRIQAYLNSIFLNSAKTQKIYPFPNDISPSLVFLSISDGKTSARVAWSDGVGLIETLRKASWEIERFVQDGYKLKWLKLDIVDRVTFLGNVYHHTPLTLNKGLEGLAFSREIGLAILPEQMMAYELLDKTGQLQWDNLLDYIKKKHPEREGQITFCSPLYSFTTTSYFFDGKNLLSLYRGHRLYKKIDAPLLLESAKQAGEYLKHATLQNGMFRYKYYPSTDRFSRDYNLLRHAGTIYAMLELYEITRDKKLLAAVDRSMQYLLQNIHLGKIKKENTAYLVEEKYVKLGGNALAAIAIAKYIEITQSQRYMPILIKLGKGIQDSQKEDGQFFPHKYFFRSGKIVDFTSSYYPGESLLAMVRIYRVNPEPKWLNTAEKGAQYLINKRDIGIPVSKLLHDHWLLYALQELSDYRPKNIYRVHAKKIASAIQLKQNSDSPYPDWIGAFSTNPHSCPTATRAEGMIAAYRFHLYEDRKKQDQLLLAIYKAIAFQLQTQFQPEMAMYFSAPDKCLGGFYRNLTEFDIRIDYLQHNISSLLGLYLIIKK